MREPKTSAPRSADLRLACTISALVLLGGCGGSQPDPNRFWKPAASQGLGELSLTDQGRFKGLLGSAEIPSADQLVTSRGLFTFQDGAYRLIAPPIRQISETAKIQVGHISAIYLSFSGEDLAYSDGKSVVTIRSGRKKLIPLKGERLIAADFLDDGRLIFVTQFGAGKVSVHDDRAKLATLFLKGSPSPVFSCKSPEKGQAIVFVRRGQTSAEAYTILRSGQIQTLAIDPAVTPDCEAAEGSADGQEGGLSWAGSNDGKIEEAGGVNARDMGASRLLRAEDRATRRVLYRNLDVTGSSEPMFVPMVWEVANGGLQPKFFYNSRIGPLNGGGHVEPLSKTSYVLVAADGVVAITKGQTCLLSDEGLGIGGFYVRRGDFIAVYNPYTNIAAIVPLRTCGAE